jgi:hypothetical protein
MRRSLICCAVVIVAACAGGQRETGSGTRTTGAREPWVQGTVVSIELRENGKSVLLDDVPVGGCSDQAYLFISTTTRVRARVGTGTTVASIDDVVVGQRLKAWLRGTIRETCRPQMSAEAVLIWKR